MGVREGVNTVDAPLSVVEVLVLRSPAAHPGACSWSWCGSCLSHPTWGWGSPADHPLCSGDTSGWLFALLSLQLPSHLCPSSFQGPAEGAEQFCAYLGKDGEAPISTGNGPFLKKTHLPSSAGDLEQIDVLGEGGKEAKSSAVLLCAQRGLAGSFAMGILGLSSHSRRVFHPKPLAITGLSRLKTSPWTKLLLVTQSELQGGPKLWWRARARRKGLASPQAGAGRMGQGWRLGRSAALPPPPFFFFISLLPLSLEGWLRRCNYSIET